MPYYSDCYVHVDSRSSKLGIRLIKTFLPDGALESAEEYFIPQYAESPKHTFSKAVDLMNYLEKHPDETHSIYWTSLKDQNPIQVNIHYIDTGTILGVAVPSETEEDQILERLKSAFNTDCGYITHEAPPPSTLDEFIRTLRNIEN
ncbi:MAG: hypothetical protein AAF571_15330 [Verrucomicrobiota bacterium]